MKKRFFSVFKYLTILVFSCYLIVWLISPLAIHYIAQQQLAPFKLTLSPQSHIRYNPFISAITIKDLEINKAQEKVLALKKLKIEFNLLQLLFDRLMVKSATINGLFIKVAAVEEKIIIAGVALPSGDNKAVPTEEQPTSANKYQLIMPSLQLTKSELLYVSPVHSKTIALNNITVSELRANTLNQTANVSLQLGIDQSKLTTRAQLAIDDGKISINNDLSLTQFQLSSLAPWLPAELSALSGALTLSGQQKIQLSAEHSLIELVNSKQTIDNLVVQNQELHFTAQQQLMTSPKLSITLLPNQSANLDGTFELDIKNISLLSQKDQQASLLTLAQLNLGTATLTTQQQDPELHFNKITLTDAVISKNSATDVPAFTQFEQLIINDTYLSALGTKIDEIELSGLITDILLDKQKNIANLAAITQLSKPDPALEKSLTDENQTTSAKSETIPQAKKEGYAFSLNNFQLTNDAQIHFKDASVNPVYQRNFTINKLSLGPIDTKQPELESVLHLTGSSNKYTNYTFNGTAKPFKEVPLFTLKGQVDELNLPDVSTYIKNALKYEIKSGHLNLALDVKLKGDEIAGKADILLQGIDLTAANDHEVDSLSDKTAIPFSAAIGMLKDSKGNVELNIPLSGKTSDPSFGATGFLSLLIKQATMMAAKDYLMTTFVPYAQVVSIALAAGNHLLKVRFNDLLFTPTQVDLSAEHQQFLLQFATLMKDKKKTQITLCAIATPEDINLAAGTKITDKTAIEKLHEISSARLDNFKQRMVDDFQIKSSRMLLCTPQIDSSAKAKPRITFTSN